MKHGNGGGVSGRGPDAAPPSSPVTRNRVTVVGVFVATTFAVMVLLSLPINVIIDVLPVPSPFRLALGTVERFLRPIPPFITGEEPGEGPRALTHIAGFAPKVLPAHVAVVEVEHDRSLQAEQDLVEAVLVAGVAVARGVAPVAWRGAALGFERGEGLGPRGGLAGLLEPPGPGALGDWPIGASAPSGSPRSAPVVTFNVSPVIAR